MVSIKFARLPLLAIRSTLGANVRFFSRSKIMKQVEMNNANQDPSEMSREELVQTVLRTKVSFWKTIAKEKDAHMKAIIREKTLFLNEKGARFKVERAYDNLLREKNDAERSLLFFQNRFNVRGVLEFIANKHAPNITKGVQAQIDHITGLHSFKSILAEVTTQRKLAPRNVNRCCQNLYHSISKHFHPAGNDGVFIDTSLTETAISHGDGAALEAIFRFAKVPYKYRGVEGDTVSFAVSGGKLIQWVSIAEDFPPPFN